MNKPSIILIIATSLDGRIGLPNGGETHLGSIEDKKLLSQSLLNVDATLFGSGTLIAHKSTFLIKNFFKNNTYEINDYQPISIIASNCNAISNKWNYFKQPIKRWLIKSTKKYKTIMDNFDKQIIFSNNWQETLITLKREGINSIALLGGAGLISSFANEDLIDEIKITIIPKLIGGEFTWIKTDNKENLFQFNKEWKIEELKELSTDEIFIHYKKI